MMSHLVSNERTILYLYNDSSNTLETKAVRGARISRFALSPEQGIVGAVYTSQRGVLLESPCDDPRFDRSLDQKRKSATRNMVCVPLKAGEKCLGCLEVANKTAGEFTESDYNFINIVAGELSAGLIETTAKPVTAKLKEHNEFQERIAEVANENLLTPLLKNIVIILASILKSEK